MRLSRRRFGARERWARAQFEVELHRLFNVLPATRVVQVALKRGPKVAQTRAHHVRDGEVEPKEKLVLVATLFLDP